MPIKHLTNVMRSYTLLLILIFPLAIRCQTVSDSLRKPCVFPKYIDDKEIYEILEYDAQFPGGKDSLELFIRNNFTKPEACKFGDEKIFIKFIVDYNGICMHPCVMTIGNKYIDPELENAALSIIEKMPAWEPAKHAGKYKNQFRTAVISLNN